MSNHVISEQHKLGYFFHPRRDPSDPGHPQLDIVLRDVPTGLHYDPERMQIGVTGVHGEIESITVHHPWRWYIRHYPVCAGRIICWDRKAKAVEAFTFGGELQIEPDEMYTTCTVSSPVPILRLTEGSLIPTMLALEVEILLAERRAAWVHDLGAFEERLATTEPNLLYLVCLEALKGNFEAFPLKARDDSFHQFVRFLHVETEKRRKTLNGGPPVPALAELL